MVTSIKNLATGNKEVVSATKERKVRKKKFLGAAWGYWSFNVNGLNQDIVIDPNQLLDLYRQNPDVRQAVNKISNYVWKRGSTLIDKKTQEPLPNEDAGETKKEYMNYLKTPTELTFNQYKRRFFRDLLVTGQVYITYTLGLDWVMNGTQFIDPRTVTKNISSAGIVDGYMQNSWNTAGRKFTPFAEQATKDMPFLGSYVFEVHVKNEYMGMWQLESVVWDALSDLWASKRNYYVMHNDIKTPSMFLLDPDISDDEHDILIEQLRDNYSGIHNQGKPIVWQWIKDVKNLMLSPRDMEYVNQKKLTTDKVASTFWVPKYILWYTENVNLNNGEGNKQEFIEGTVDPNQALFSFIINDFFDDVAEVPWIWFEETKYSIVFHTDPVETDITRDKLALEKLNAGTITLDEYRVDDGRDPYVGVENSGKPMVNRSQILVEDVSFDLWTTANEV